MGVRNWLNISINVYFIYSMNKDRNIFHKKQQTAHYFTKELNSFILCVLQKRSANVSFKRGLRTYFYDWLIWGLLLNHRCCLFDILGRVANGFVMHSITLLLHLVESISLCAQLKNAAIVNNISDCKSLFYFFTTVINGLL